MLVAVASAKRMRESGGGRIVLVSSINGAVSEPETAHYSAAKAAINSLARSLAVDFASHRIAVNAVSPGWVDTPMIAEFVAEATPEDLGRINPLARLGRPEELAGVITYLATEAPEFLTGSTLFVDGGQTAIAPVP
jgi:NAD(P)-dependent dehydrogenase (short-subunit alcohol dehydrogenase family)